MVEELSVQKGVGDMTKRIRAKGAGRKSIAHPGLERNEKLLRAMAKRNLTQMSVAAKTGISNPTLSGIVLGRINADDSEKAAIARAVGRTVRGLF